MMMEQPQTLELLIKREEDRDPRRGNDVSDELKKVIEKTKAEIRAAFADGKRAKASLKE